MCSWSISPTPSTRSLANVGVTATRTHRTPTQTTIRHMSTSGWDSWRESSRAELLVRQERHQARLQGLRVEEQIWRRQPEAVGQTGRVSAASHFLLIGAAGTRCSRSLGSLRGPSGRHETLYGFLVHRSLVRRRALTQGQKAGDHVLTAWSADDVSSQPDVQPAK